MVLVSSIFMVVVVATLALSTTWMVAVVSPAGAWLGAFLGVAGLGAGALRPTAGWALALLVALYQSGWRNSSSHSSTDLPQDWRICTGGGAVGKEGWEGHVS